MQFYDLYLAHMFELTAEKKIVKFRGKTTTACKVYFTFKLFIAITNDIEKKARFQSRVDVDEDANMAMFIPANILMNRTSFTE